ncbi:mitochondrial carrier domain-containing protein [Lobosporangium transversale]|uniref:Mitochondrial carrier domain-containing protein n=1 Tax=Lobosporangium transversale TaxID=64571 RepID=A0A1Y2GZQ4_9FUNG|nr:mitochondrial carrier domain-containing protein [Lobosporangium transversale]ORZ27755.1 mitochondrial carrier domain-containing protein [Lobosporangium transversale]|eukprot:XP_021885458.1 mitochondrial carrier domain-containing protein [Lobosporangium transversale]
MSSSSGVTSPSATTSSITHLQQAFNSSPSLKRALPPTSAVEPQPPYIDVLIAGGLGGTIADFIMHSVDTVKTRLQGQPSANPPKYNNMFHAYSTILREEGVSRGLYSGVAPAMTGSLPGTTLYFGTYEYTKRTLTAAGCPDTLAHLAGGSIGDFFASFIYVPSEVLKTRMQLQGRYNNPSFISGYNYKNTLHALQMIVKYDGIGALYQGYRATLLRDVPFSALQFAFYEKFKVEGRRWEGREDGQMSLHIETLCGAIAGGMAGFLTTPLDVMKTLLQTQVKKPTASIPTSTAVTTTMTTAVAANTITNAAAQQKYYVGIWDGLKWNLKHHGVIGGLFRGVGPRVFWTSLQSALMFVIYEQAIHLQENMRYFGQWPYGSGSS